MQTRHLYTPNTNLAFSVHGDNMEQLHLDYQILTQTQQFYQRFYRFPNYLKVGGLVVMRETIIEVAERYLNGRTFQWFKRRKLVGQLNDAILNLQTK